MKHSFKAIISDFDGTLIDKNDSISTKNQEAISSWLKLGNIFSICTARQFLHIEKACNTLKLTSPQIVRGGAEIVNPSNGEVLYSEYLNSDELKELIHVLKNESISFTAEQNNILYTKNGLPNQNVLGVTYKDINDMSFEKIAKVVLWTESLDEKFIEHFVKETIKDKFPSIHAIKAYSPVRKAWDITSVKATKAIAIGKLAEMLQISTTEMVGIGDGYNDYPLLSACGYKIAMGNAHAELKEIADFVAPSYEEDGVCEAIHHVLNM